MKRRRRKVTDHHILFFEDDAPTTPILLSIDPSDEWDQCDTIPSMPRLEIASRDDRG